jgi:hypothetical protein
MAVAPAALLGWVLAFWIGAHFLDWAVLIFCPQDEREGFDCYARSWRVVEETIISIFVGLSAVLAILFGVVAAPENKYFVAKIIYIIGFFLAVILSFVFKGFIWPLLSSIAAGFISVAILKNQLTSRSTTRLRRRTA